MTEQADTVHADPVRADPAVEIAPGRRSARVASGIPLITVTLVAGGLLLAGSAVSAVGLVVAIAVVQAALVASWVFGIGLPGRIGALILGLATAGGADVVLAKWHEHGYQPVIGVLGLAIPAMFIHQLTRGVVRARVVESLSDIAVLLVSVAAMAGLIVLRYQGDGDRSVLAVVAAIGLALIVAQLADLIHPVARFDPLVERGLLAVVLGVAAGAAAGYAALHSVVDFAGARSAFAGAAVGAVACLLAVGASFVGAHSTLTPRADDATADDAAGDTMPADAAGDTLPDDASADAPRVVDDEVPVWAGVPRLRPVASALIVIALSSPAGYVLINALGN
ncbi:MAG: conserved rane protein of unknown function [Frankiales bacterium]|nr:conserved rane protein of unknown function [Frankiales bacterium]